MAGTCTVALTSIVVDTEATKTEHFYQWTTHKKLDPTQCALEVAINGTANQPLMAKEPIEFALDGVFSVCGRKHPSIHP